MSQIDSFIANAEKTEKKNKEIAEIDIENAFCRYATSRGCLALKLVELNKRGFPDRTILCKGGGIFFIEFKKRKGKLSAIQKVVRRNLESFGFEYYICDKIGQAEKILDREIEKT